MDFLTQTRTRRVRGGLDPDDGRKTQQIKVQNVNSPSTKPTRFCGFCSCSLSISVATRTGRVAHTRENTKTASAEVGWAKPQPRTFTIRILTSVRVNGCLCVWFSIGCIDLSQTQRDHVKEGLPGLFMVKKKTAQSWNLIAHLFREARRVLTTVYAAHGGSGRRTISFYLPAVKLTLCPGHE